MFKMKNCLLLFCCLCLVFPSFGAKEVPVPWKEVRVYAKGSEQNHGKLVRCRAWTPDSPDYLAYSIYYDQDGSVENFVNQKWKDAFARGFYAYRRVQDPVRPFKRVFLPSPPHIVRMMQEFPSNGEKNPNGLGKDDCGHFVPMESDHFNPYWRRVDRVMAMAQQQGHIYFFPDKEGGEEVVHWDGENQFHVGSVSPFPDSRGLIVAHIRKKRETGLYGRVAINPETGKSIPLKKEALITRSREDPKYLTDKLSLVKDAGRFCGRFAVSRREDDFYPVSGRDDASVSSGNYNDLGDDCFAVDGQVWCSRGDNAVLLYPEPWEEKGAPLAVTLVNDGSPGEDQLNLQIKFTNQGKSPIVLPEGWGTVVLRFSSTPDHVDNYLEEVPLHTETVLVEGNGDMKDQFPSLTLDEGQSAAAMILFEARDRRIIPRDEEVYIKATFSTAGPPETPGHGMYTSPSIKVSRFIPSRN